MYALEGNVSELGFPREVGLKKLRVSHCPHPHPHDRVPGTVSLVDHFSIAAMVYNLGLLPRYSLIPPVRLLIIPQLFAVYRTRI